MIYSEATDALRQFVDATGIPVGETQAGKGALPRSIRCRSAASASPARRAANALARDADLVIVVGTRLSDFTTASKTAFQHPDVRFIAINVAEIDAFKHAALPLVGDARAALEELTACSSPAITSAASTRNRSRTPARRRMAGGSRARLQSAVRRDRSASAVRIGPGAGHRRAARRRSAPTDVVVCAAGSLPGDLHKLWRARDPKGYHLEYGYSCMGYEIAGGLGVKMAAPEREVYVMVGDGSYLMMAQEIVTAVQEGIKLTIVLLDNHGFASIGGLSESVGSGGFGTRYRYRNRKPASSTARCCRSIFAANAASLGARRLSRRHAGRACATRSPDAKDEHATVGDRRARRS